MAPNTPTTYAEVVAIFVNLLNLLMPLLVATGLVVFLWGIIKFLYAGGSEESVKNGKQLMLWGIITFFVMISFTGIVWWFSGFLGTPTTGIPFLPESESEIQENLSFGGVYRN